MKSSERHSPEGAMRHSPEGAMLHTPEGVRDIYGRELARKQAVTQAILQKMHLYGYEDIQTPTFEYFDVFSQEIGTTSSKELYKFFDKEGSTLVLRPDFTPSAARCAAKYYREEEAPLRFCYQGSAFINVSDLQGKLRESTQMGVELINDDSANADAEVIALLIESLRSTGLQNFQISIGNADFFRGICAEAGIDEETEYALRAQISGKNYFAAEKLLMEQDVPEKERNRLLQVGDFIGSAEALKAAGDAADNRRSADAVERLEEVRSVLQKYGLAEYASFDLSMLSKYNYYTGVIFRGFTYGVGDAVATGGRYDSLIGHFGKQAPAVGFMIPIDLLMEALRSQNIAIAVPEEPVRVFYTKENYADSLRKVLLLRREGRAAVLLPER
jgi:ATP phosphoribosyltransferase regulatory subunit